MTEKKKMWNGGKTNISKEEAKIFRQMEDSYDIDDSEIVFREDLVKREYSLSKKPLHELYTTIDYNEKTKVSSMGGLGGPIEAMRSKQGGWKK